MASPPTARVVAVIDLLVRSEEPLGLSDIARGCAISKPTCLAILTELTARDYLVCDPVTKTYRPGAALVAAGRAAERASALPAAVTDGLQQLSDRFGMTGIAFSRVGDQFAVLEATAPSGVDPVTRAGETFPFMLPTAITHVLTDPDEPGDESGLGGVGHADVREMVDEYRAVGYLVENLSPTLERVYRILGSAPHRVSSDVRSLIVDLLSGMKEPRLLRHAELSAASATDTHRVGVIVAPVPSSAGLARPILLALAVLADATAREIAVCGRALSAAAHAV